MRKSSLLGLILVTVSYLLMACGAGTSNEVNKNDSLHVSSLHKDSVAAIKNNLRRPVNKNLNNLARYIAGMEITDPSFDSTLLHQKDWANFSKTMNETWANTGEPKIAKMKPWVTKELDPIKATNLFYPFAGADALNAVTLFPHVKNYYMIGLEPVGTLPDFNKILKAKDIDHYFKTVGQSLESILNFSFFRTKSMAVEFHQSDVNGTIHVLLLFLERTGNSIIDIQPVAVNPKGELIVYKDFNAAEKDTLRNKGAAISFVGPDSLEHTLTYFSINLSNEAFPKNSGFKAFLKKQQADVTYIKSASYLMHKAYFSDIRSTILSNSRAILQDDSGIPWKLFNDSTATVTLFGAYTGTISLFPNCVQADLDNAYKKDPTKVHALPFGIGYKYVPGESNLMLRVKK